MIESALQGLFSPVCAVAVAVPASNPPVLPEAEAWVIRHAVPARQREFAAGRTAARSALAKIHFPDATIGVGEDRAPQWPPGVVGSIAHTQAIALAVVAQASDVRAIGVDIEESGAVRAELRSHILGPTEQAWIDRLPEAEQARWATVIFCAKEAFYKFQYPLTHIWLDFNEADVTLVPDEGRFDLRLSEPLVIDSTTMYNFRGRFAFDGAFTLAGLDLLVAS